MVIEKNGYLEVPPLSAISDSSSLGTSEDYINLNNTLLFLRLKIMRPHGADIPGTAKVYLINYPGVTIFSEVDVSLGDCLISQSSSAYLYRCIIEILLNYSKDMLESLFSVGLFFKDTAGQMNETDPVGRNAGLTKRWHYTTGSKVVELLVPIHSKIFFQENFMLNGVDIKIQMIRGQDDFCLMTDEDGGYKLSVNSLANEQLS